MARTIDADALKEEVDAWWWPDMSVREIWDVIDLAPTVGGWISVKDRLPEDGQEVVVIAVNGFCEVVDFEERTGRWLGMDGWYPTDRIAHWMPLPTPPEEVKLDG